jgi:DNA-binding response OmpR family regulator
VILVDDDEDLLFATALALKSGGFSTLTFVSCDDAVAALSDSHAPRPWAVLLDVHLGRGMSPATFITWLREHGHADVPVLLVSAAPDATSVAQRMGAAGCLNKPFSVAELVGRVNAMRG